MDSEIVKIGKVSVESGKIMIADPLLVDWEFKKRNLEEKRSTYDIFKNKNDGKFWQFCIKSTVPAYDYVLPFPGTYGDVIPEYGKTPEELKNEGIFEKTDLDTMPWVEDGEFSIDGIIKQKKINKGMTGQINFPDGEEGLAVFSQAGWGDGLYDVYAEIITVKVPTEHKRVKRIWIDFMEEDKN